MKNIINSETLTQFKERIELGMAMLHEQTIPVNTYAFSFIVQELNKYILEDEHPRYTSFVDGKLEADHMDISVFIADRFQQGEWIDLLTFVYPKEAGTQPKTPVVKSLKGIVPAASCTIVPVPVVENFDLEVQTRKSTSGCIRESRRGVSTFKHQKFKYTTYTEYVNFVSVLFDEFSGCTECLNKSLITAFLGNFSYPEAFVSSGKTVRQHLRLKPDIELTEDVKKKFQIDWGYFLDNWSDNAIALAAYKTADATRTYNSVHKSIDLIEQRVGAGTFALTDFGKVIWEHIHETLGYMEPDTVVKKKATTTSNQGSGIDILPTPVSIANRVDMKDHVESKVEEAIKVRHMGWNKCEGCVHLDKCRKWCNKRAGYIDQLEHDDTCREEPAPEAVKSAAEESDVERICYNCKKWHSGNNPGGLKAIACRCPIQGKKTLTDDTCNKFVAIVKKEN